MNGRKAKELRRLAGQDVFDHYLTLLEEDQQKDLTQELALVYTPTVTYVDVDTGSAKKPYTKRTMVSENTIRWFILQRKKQYVKTTRQVA